MHIVDNVFVIIVMLIALSAFMAFVSWGMDGMNHSKELRKIELETRKVQQDAIIAFQGCTRDDAKKFDPWGKGGDL